MFKSKAQRIHMWKHHPKIAQEWEEKTKIDTLPYRASGRSIEERIAIATKKKSR